MSHRGLLLSGIVAMIATGCASPLAHSAEAKRELARLVAEEEAKGYPAWRRAIESKTSHVHREFTAASGQWYQVDVDPVWDDQPGGVIRVIVSIDDGGRSAYVPLCDGALLAPPAEVQ